MENGVHSFMYTDKGIKNVLQWCWRGKLKTGVRTRESSSGAELRDVDALSVDGIAMHGQNA
jgi:hypothetical protein